MLVAHIAEGSALTVGLESGDLQCGLRAWSAKWVASLLGRERGARLQGAASSSDEPPGGQRGVHDEQPYAEREREEAQQQREDEELFEWHSREQARLAQAEDRAAVAANMGWSTRTSRTMEVTISASGSASTDAQTMVLRLRPGEQATLHMKVSESTRTEYLLGGEVQPEEVAQKQIQDAEEAAFQAEQNRVTKRPRTQRTFNTADEEVRPWYNRWVAQLVTWEELNSEVGRDMAEFIRAAALVDPAEIDTQILIPDEQGAEAEVHHVPATMPYEPDDEETVPMGIFPELPGRRRRE